MRKLSDRLSLTVLLATIPVFCIVAMTLVVRGGMKDIKAQLGTISTVIMPQHTEVIELSAAMSKTHTKARRAVMWSVAGLPAEKIKPLTDEAQSIAAHVGDTITKFAPIPGEGDSASLAAQIKTSIGVYKKILGRCHRPDRRPGGCHRLFPEGG